MKVSAHGDAHEIIGETVGLTAQNGPVKIESVSGDGGIQLSTVGPVDIQAGGATIVLAGGDEKSTIRVDPGNGGAVAIISGTPTGGSLIALDGAGIGIGTGGPASGSRISLGASEAKIAVGPPGIGSSITMTSDSISFKVGTVEFSISTDGIRQPEDFHIRYLQADLNEMRQARFPAPAWPPL